MQPPPSGQRNRWLVPAIIAAVVVVAAVVAGFFLLGGGGSARDTVDAYLKELQAGDAAGAYEYFGAASRQTQTQEQFATTLRSVLAQSGGIKSFTIEKVDETGSTAAVQYRLTTGLGEETWQVTMVKEDGDWKVDANQLRQISNTY